ncbi:MAG: hypothetical protein KDC73_04505 [Ignavibacteriae bacterium]|nr:hypothetical protein [Ignavibacteriota bacterium]MCB0723939.1 hypothetical protein [Ignavibacteriota bacterium]MCB9244016.1 hypothetical protein [Ignavibacteriales bacterium]
MHDLIEGMIPVIAIIFTFGIPGLIIFYYIYMKHKERMRMMEKGLTAQDMKAFYIESEKKPRNPYSALKWGILFLFVGLGIFISNIIYYQYDFDEGLGFGITITFAGLGFLLYYSIVSSKLKKEAQKISETN